MPSICTLMYLIRWLSEAVPVSAIVPLTSGSTPSCRLASRSSRWPATSWPCASASRSIAGGTRSLFSIVTEMQRLRGDAVGVRDAAQERGRPVAVARDVQVTGRDGETPPPVSQYGLRYELVVGDPLVVRGSHRDVQAVAGLEAAVYANRSSSSTAPLWSTSLPTVTLVMLGLWFLTKSTACVS